MTILSPQKYNNDNIATTEIYIYTTGLLFKELLSITQRALMQFTYHPLQQLWTNLQR